MTGSHRRPRGDDGDMPAPPRIDHVQPVPDSRGLIGTPASLPAAWSGPRSGPVAVLDPCPTLTLRGTCPVCGLEDAEVVVRWKPPAPPSSELDLSELRALVGEYQPCADIAACFDRRRAREAAQREQAAAEPVPGEPAGPAAKPPGKPRTRPSQARAKLTAKTPGAAPGSGTEPPEGGAA